MNKQIQEFAKQATKFIDPHRDDIIRMAREAGLFVGTNMSGVELVGHEYVQGSVLVHLDVEDLRRFAVIVAAAEREACSRVADMVAREIDDTNGTATYVSKAIRARGDA